MRRKVSASLKTRGEDTRRVPPATPPGTTHTATLRNGPASHLEAKKNSTDTARVLALPSSRNLTLCAPPNPIAPRIRPSPAASPTSVCSSGARGQTGTETGGGSRPPLQHSCLTCHPFPPFQLLRPPPTLSTCPPLPPPLLCPHRLWSHPPPGHPSPPPWLPRVRNFSTRDCARYLSPRGFPSRPTYPSKPRAFARGGGRPTSPAWRARSEGPLNKIPTLTGESDHNLPVGNQAAQQTHSETSAQTNRQTNKQTTKAKRTRGGSEGLRSG